jgi:hypothetical protein
MLFKKVGNQMTTELEIKKALDFLANGFQMPREVKGQIERLLEEMSKGTPEASEAAKWLRLYAEYPASLEACEAAFGLHAAVLTREGRKAAGLEPRIKGKKYKPEDVGLNDHLMLVMVANQLGSKTEEDVFNAAIDYLGDRADDRTVNAFIDALRPRAKDAAIFQKAFLNAWKLDKPLL